jgi:hypothetical protein
VQKFVRVAFILPSIKLAPYKHRILINERSNAAFLEEATVKRYWALRKRNFKVFHFVRS